MAPSRPAPGVSADVSRDAPFTRRFHSSFAFRGGACAASPEWWQGWESEKRSDGAVRQAAGGGSDAFSTSCRGGGGALHACPMDHRIAGVFCFVDTDCVCAIFIIIFIFFFFCIVVVSLHDKAVLSEALCGRSPKKGGDGLATAPDASWGQSLAEA